MSQRTQRGYTSTNFRTWGYVRTVQRMLRGGIQKRETPIARSWRIWPSAVTQRRDRLSSCIRIFANGTSSPRSPRGKEVDSRVPRSRGCAQEGGQPSVFSMRKGGWGATGRQASVRTMWGIVTTYSITSVSNMAAHVAAPSVLQAGIFHVAHPSVARLATWGSSARHESKVESKREPC